MAVPEFSDDGICLESSRPTREPVLILRNFSTVISDDKSTMDEKLMCAFYLYPWFFLNNVVRQEGDENPYGRT